MGTNWRIAKLTTILRCLALASVALCVWVLPGANAKLPWSTHPFIPWLAGAAFACWVASRIVEWKSPRSHEVAVWWMVLLISTYGWLVTFFPSAMVERVTGAILELDKSPWLAFGTIDQGISEQAMVQISSAMMLLLVALDFASERRGRYMLALAVTFAGFVTAVTGLCFQTKSDLAQLWQVKHIPNFVFGTFWYHGNTAAFLNLCWPVGVWLCVLLLHYGLRTFKQQVALSLLVVAVMVQIIAVFVNISKMGHFLLLLEFSILIGASFAVLKPTFSTMPINKRKVILLIVIAVGLLVLGAWLSGAGAVVGRWDNFAKRHFDDPARRHAAMMALQIGTDHGWTGTGPGTFEWVAAHYTPLDPLLQEGRWRHAHNDYAEFFAEWGWPGVLFFILLLGFPGRRLFNALREAFGDDRRQGMSFQRKSGLICFSTAIVSVLLHAVMDFPLQIDAIRPLFAVMVGVALAMTHSSASSVTRRPLNSQREPAWK